MTDNDRSYVLVHEEGIYDDASRTILMAIPFCTDNAIDQLRRACMAATRVVRQLCLQRLAYANTQMARFPANCFERAPLPTREEYAKQLWLSMVNEDDDEAVLVLEIPNDSIVDELFKSNPVDSTKLLPLGRFERVRRRYPVDPSLYWSDIPLNPETDEQKAEMERRRVLLEQLGPRDEVVMRTGGLEIADVSPRVIPLQPLPSSLHRPVEPR